MKRIWFYVIVCLQVLFLILMSISYYTMDTWGESIRLKTAPVDPRDPFYGDFVTLSYEVEMVPADKWNVSADIGSGEKIYLLLEPDEKNLYTLVKASAEKPEVSEEEVVLPARLDWHDPQRGVYMVDIGLDRYFIEEGTGQQYEQNREDLIVEVILAPWGQKKIDSVTKAE
ncbi:GDYXXLXY domain-containing protein [Halobacillus halophilus]|uniref:GDYXXLXY domain-containing protein n=1 Tax=Halobacillus halophilus TaxID=1570 RepID=UPI001CD6D85B|nr:GDYXXLXY domain-containing protein [Halobacillus halophilus]MCA1011298.1 GDYXXLXY domain-containing protein [Halobacillus halophilus]